MRAPAKVSSGTSPPRAALQRTDLANLVCKTDKTVGAIAGTAYSKVVVPSGWAKGSPLKICSLVQTTGSTGLVPYPSGGWLKQAGARCRSKPTPRPSRPGLARG